MLDYKWNKIFSYFFIENMLKGNGSNEDMFIFDKLKNIPLNKANIEKIKNSLNIEKAEDTLYQKEDVKPNLSKAVLEKISRYKPNYLSDNPKNKSPKAGDIWLTKRIPKLPEGYYIEPVVEAKYIFLLTDPITFISDESDEEIITEYNGYQVVLALPISLDVNLATESDYIILGNNEFIGIEFMIETGLEFNALTGNLEKFIGSLSKDQNEELLNLYFKQNGMEYDESKIPKNKIGTAIKSEFDVKFLYKEIESQNIRYLEEPVEYLDDFFKVDLDVNKTLTKNLDAGLYSASNEKIREDRLAFASSNEQNDFFNMHHIELIKFVPDNFAQLQISLTKADNKMYCYKLNSNINSEDLLKISLIDKKSREIIFEEESAIPPKGDIQYSQITGKLKDKFIEVIIEIGGIESAKKNLLF